MSIWVLNKQMLGPRLSASWRSSSLDVTSAETQRLDCFSCMIVSSFEARGWASAGDSDISKQRFQNISFYQRNLHTNWWRVTHWTVWLGLHSSAALSFPRIVSFQGLRNHSPPWHCSGRMRKRYGKALAHLPLIGELAVLYLKVWFSRMKLRTFCAVWLSMRWASRNTSSKLNMEMMGWSRIPREANISTAPCILSITTMASVTFEDFTRGSKWHSFRFQMKRTKRWIN